jgi:uncharacterized protein (UPF0332 family)
MNDARGNLIRYRIEKARATLVDARILADAQRWNTCVNRLYYACFYAVSALLALHDLSSVRHTGVRSLFNQHFVKTGKIPEELAQLYNDIFERCQESDYMDFITFEESQIILWLPEVEKFVEHIAREIALESD